MREGGIYAALLKDLEADADHPRRYTVTTVSARVKIMVAMIATR